MFFYLSRSPITMGLFLHLGKSPFTTQPLFFFSMWVGHPLQLYHSSCFFIWVGHSLQWDHSFTWVGHQLQWDHSSFFYLGRSPMKINQGKCECVGWSPIKIDNFEYVWEGYPGK